MGEAPLYSPELDHAWITANKNTHQPEGGCMLLGLGLV